MNDRTRRHIIVTWVSLVLFLWAGAVIWDRIWGKR